MIKAEEPSFTLPTSDFNSYNSEVAEAKKVKLMYTSDFLKSFDKAPKSTLLPLEDQESGKSNSKDNQILQLTHLVLKVRDLVLGLKNEEASKQLQEIFNENFEGRQLLADQIPNGNKTVPNLKIPANESFDSQPAPVSPTATPTKELYRSPRHRMEDALAASPTAIPTSPPLGSKSVTLRSPRKGLTKSASQTGLNTLLSGPITPPKDFSSVVSGGSNSKAGLMKRSPSMPVIPKEKQPAQEAPQPIKPLTKTKSSIDLTGGFKKGDSPAGKNSSPSKMTDASPRKGIKKSVSMSSICVDSDEKAAALKCTSLEEIVGQIYPLTKYQAGCRFLQKKLEEQPDTQHVTLVFNEVFDHLIELMTDPYGQYLVPKLMKHCDKSQRQAIVTKIAPKIATFACHTYGIHGVQKILEFLTDDQIGTFVEVIKPSAIQLAKDPKGNYLIQSFLKQFPSERNQFIFDAIMTNCLEVSTHKVGCTLVNRCIDYANDSQLPALIKQIAANCFIMVQDQFGNYVIQHILSTKPQFSPTLIRSMLGHIPELSVQKFSSNVIEKCLQVAVSTEPDLYNAIVDEIAEANLLELLQDRYANFVIQTALDVADDTQHAKLVKMILPYIHQIKTPYVMHIQKKILQV